MSEYFTDAVNSYLFDNADNQYIQSKFYSKKGAYLSQSFTISFK